MELKKIGYRKESTAYKLKFEAYDGLEVTVKSLNVGELLELSSLAGKVNPADIEASLQQTDQMLSTFADKLISWNLEDEDGNPVPATLDGVKSQEMPFVSEIISTWMKEVSSVNTNLGKKSDTMPTLAVLPTATLDHQD